MKKITRFTLFRICAAVMLLLATALIGPGVAASNVENGNFSDGNTGFSSQYGYVTDGPGQSELYPEGLYAVHYNPNDLHSDFYNMGDHTTGSGLMMIINGDPNIGKIVWEGTTNKDLVVGQTYNFSAWVAQVCGGAIASLTFKADGATIGTLSPPSSGWARVFGTFTAAHTRPTLQMTNSQGAQAGNDFAIDDIDVRLSTSVSVTTAPDPSSLGQSVTLTATVSPSAATGTITFKDGGTTLGSAPIIGGQAEFSTSSLSVGEHTIYAEYGGDGDHDPGSGSDHHTVLNLPEIDVQRPAGNTLADGSTDNIGEHPYGTVNLEYTICNLLGSQLNIPSAGITAANMINCSGFSVDTVLPLNIDAGNCVTLHISFHVTDHGPFSFDMDIANNDGNENPYDIAITGTGLAPEIDAQRPAGTSIPDGGTDNIGDKLVGVTVVTYTIDNSAGNATLNITSVTGSNYVNSSGLVAVTPLPINVAAGGATTLQVSFVSGVPGTFSLIMHLANNDVNENPYDITLTGTAWPPPEAIFYATPTMGCPGMLISFRNNSKGMTNAWWWDFGDGITSTAENPTHKYVSSGQFTVSLIAANPAAKDTLVVHELIWIYGYGAIRWSPLALVDNSFAFPEESWEMAIDGDVSGWVGTATVEGNPPFVLNGNPPFAVFEFEDKTTKPIDGVRLLTDTGVGFKERWVRNFHIMVSTTGIADQDFVTVFSGAKVEGGWQEFTFNEVLAKYIKFVIDTPSSGWRQVGEFQVCPARKVVDPLRSSMTATSPHLANGIDQSLITITLRDHDGKLISGRRDEDFCIWADPEPNMYFPVIETEDPGVYVTQLATLVGGEKHFKASVNGVPLGMVPITFIQPELTLAALELIEGSATFRGEGWDNAVDNDITGWDGTVTAGGAQCYAIFKFVDNTIKSVQKLDMLVDTGIGKQGRWVTRFRLLVSTTGTKETDFVLAYDGIQKQGGWQSYLFQVVNAKYLKLIVEFPTTGWRQLGEIKVFASSSNHFTSEDELAKQAVAEQPIPDTFTMSKNYPNPFNPITRVDFSLPAASRVEAVVYNALGQQVRTLVDASFDAGWHSVTWDGTDDAAQSLPSGTYFMHLRADDHSHILKVLMIK